MIKKQSEAPIRLKRLAVWSVATSLALLICLSGSHRYVAQLTTISVSRSVAINHSPFATPEETANRLMHAVNARCWRDEYGCYTGAQQARFTYHVMVSTRELSDSQDLSVELERVLQKFQFPLDLLDRFPSQSLDLSDISDPEAVQQKIQDNEVAYRSRLKIWEREVQPLGIDWDRLMEELQSLLTENYLRHTHDGHPSQTGIVHHLDYHVFEIVSDIEVNGARSEGTLTAIVRDPDIFQENGVRGPRTAIVDTLHHMFQTITFADRRVKRSPERIEFVKEGARWKVASVPFR